LGIKLSWSPSDHSSGYWIYRSTVKSELGERVNGKPVFGGAYVDVNVDSDTTYFYTIKVADESGETVTLETVTGEITDSDIIGKRGYILMKIGDDTMNVNGEIKEIDPGRGTAPILINDRTMVPIRAIIETIGGTAEWNESERKILLTANNHRIEMWIGRTDIRVGGAPAEMDVEPTIINDRTLLPLRFVAENIGCPIEWIGSTREIMIVYASDV
jgi:hypothetical protein